MAVARQLWGGNSRIAARVALGAVRCATPREGDGPTRRATHGDEVRRCGVSLARNADRQPKPQRQQMRSRHRRAAADATSATAAVADAEAESVAAAEAAANCRSAGAERHWGSLRVKWMRSSVTRAAASAYSQSNTYNRPFTRKVFHGVKSP